MYLKIYNSMFDLLHWVNKSMSFLVYNIYFKTKSLGYLRVLSLIDNYALIEKMYDTLEKYIIASEFDIKSKSWNLGSYYENFRETLEDFTDLFKNENNL